jgi:hypothetical protein
MDTYQRGKTKATSVAWAQVFLAAKEAQNSQLDSIPRESWGRVRKKNARGFAFVAMGTEYMAEFYENVLFIVPSL